MKVFKKTITLFVAAILCLTAFFGTPALASAEEGPVVYYIKYVAGISEWRFQKGTWEDSGYHRELYYVYQDIKDGDVVVIDGAYDINFSVNVRLSNLTLVGTDTAVVTAKGYDYVYAINNATAAINGDVDKADVYAASVVNFNDNVGFLRVLSENDNTLRADVSVVGTLDHLYGGGKDYKHFELYSFQKNSLRIVDGTVKTDPSKFSTTAPATPSSGKEYDDVPKTGDARFNPLWLVGLAVVCMFGAYKLKEEK